MPGPCAISFHVTDGTKEFPQARRCLEGWRRLAPGRLRRPRLLEDRCALGWRVVVYKQVRNSVRTLQRLVSTVPYHLRQSEASIDSKETPRLQGNHRNQGNHRKGLRAKQDLQELVQDIRGTRSELGGAHREQKAHLQPLWRCYRRHRSVARNAKHPLAGLAKIGCLQIYSLVPEGLPKPQKTEDSVITSGI